MAARHIQVPDRYLSLPDCPATAERRNPGIPLVHPGDRMSTGGTGTGGTQGTGGDQRGFDLIRPWVNGISIAHWVEVIIVRPLEDHFTIYRDIYDPDDVPFVIDVLARAGAVPDHFDVYKRITHNAELVAIDADTPVSSRTVILAVSRDLPAQLLPIINSHLSSHRPIMPARLL